MMKSIPVWKQELSGGVHAARLASLYCCAPAETASEAARYADLARDLALPVILVVGMRLGCINHALLTAEAIQARGLQLAGWVANQVDPAMLRFEQNLEALTERLPAPLLGVTPFQADGDAAGAAAGLRFPE